MPPRKPPPTPDTLIPVIGYVRVSMLKEEQISPEIQRQAITAWADRRRRRIVGWIVDLDATGRNFNRKIMEGIKAIEDGVAKEIAVWKYSRFGRNRTGNAVNLARINKVGGELQSATEEVDATTAIGKLNRGMLMEWAAFESDRSGEQWAEAHEHRRARGLPSHGRPRFGYVRRGRMPDPLHHNRTIRAPEDGPERYEVDPATGPILAELYRRYITGQGARQLVGWLNAGGIRTVIGGAWSVSAVLGYLDTGFGAGLVKTHDPECVCGKASKCKHVLFLPGAHEPVITPEEWTAYVRRRRRVAGMPPRARVSQYPLSGRIWCGHCGATMTVGMDNGVRGARYACSAYMRKGLCGSRAVQRARVEEAILDVLAVWVENIEGEPEAVSTPLVETRVDVSVLEEQQRTLNAALDRLTRKYALDLVPEDSYIRTRDSLLADLARITAQAEDAQRSGERGPAEFVPVLRLLLEEWLVLPGDRRRELVGELVESVRVFRTDPRTAWLEATSVWGDVTKVDL